MKLSNTWTVIDDKRVPAGKVATRTLRKRLEAVWRELPVAGSAAHRDRESVHRLRVATRRALAAIEAFRDLLPERRAAWFAKRLRRIRRAAGEARDLDVLTDRLGSAAARATNAPAPAPSGRARRRLVAMLSKQRDVSRQPIREQYERLVESDWPGRVERLLDDVPADRHQPAFGTYALQRFRPMIKRFFVAADHKLRDAEEMHALRIEGKQLRYAMEIFAAVFPPQVRVRCYEALEQLQNTLGEFTDHASAADRFRRWSREKAAASNREVIERILEEEEARADQARKVFSRWWNPSRRRSLRRRFERTLRKASA